MKITSLYPQELFEKVSDFFQNKPEQKELRQKIMRVVAQALFVIGVMTLVLGSFSLTANILMITSYDTYTLYSSAVIGGFCVLLSYDLWDVAEGKDYSLKTRISIPLGPMSISLNK